MNIDIKSVSGQTLLSVPINTGAKGYYSLMQHDYITLPFVLQTPIDFGIGTYVDLRGVFDEALGGKLAKIYKVCDLQNPSYNASTGGYEYELRLDAYYWLWKNKIFKYIPESAGQEASWSLTAALDVHLGVFLRNLSSLGGKYNGIAYEISIDSTVENKAVALTYENTNLINALSMMAEAWDCEWWVTENIIHFGRLEQGDAVKIEIGVEAENMTRNESKGTYATRIYAFGSTRNIPTNYRHVDETVVVNGVVQKRLMLPEGTPYIDAYPNLSTEEVVEDVVVFDNIYPRRIGTLSDIQTVDRPIEDESDEQTGTFKAYQYKDTGLTFSEDYIIEGEELRIVFQSGKLNGLDFGVTFNPNNSEPAEQLFEIVANEDYGRLLPDDTIKPENGDTYILYGFNIQLVSDQYIPNAEQELKEEAEKYVAKTKIDDGTYTVPLYSSWVKENQINRTFDAGQRILLRNQGYFTSEGRTSRVIGWEMCLDVPYDTPTYTIGESAQYSRLGELEDKVDSLTYKGQNYTSVGGSGIYVIKTNDSTPASNSNVYSALRSLSMFLRKDQSDTTNFLLKLLGGVITDRIESQQFTTGALGSGFTVKVRDDGSSYIEVDELFVRKVATFVQLMIQKLSHVGGQIILTPASMSCIRVEEYDDYYRCYFESTDGDKSITNDFVVGDQARCQTFNIKEGVSANVSNTYYWRLVVGVGDDYIDLSKSDCDTGSTVPQAGDDIVQLGNRDDATRQSAIVLSSYGNDAPYIKLYRGINSYDLTGKEFVNLSRTQIKIIADSIVMSTGKTLTEYIDESIDSGLSNIDIGGRNYILDSSTPFEPDIAPETPVQTSYELSVPLSDLLGESLTLSYEYEYSEVATNGSSDNLYRFGNEIQYTIGGETKYINNWVFLDIDAYMLSGKGKFVNTFVLPEGATPTYPDVLYFYIQINSGNVKLFNFKLERGTVATDWTPAPEDADEQIASIRQEITSQISVLEGEINLKVSEETVTEMLNGYVTTNTFNSEIQQLSDQISLKVSQSSFDELTGRVDSAESLIEQTAEQISLKVWQSDIDEAIDSINIGGRNLVKEGKYGIENSTSYAIVDVHLYEELVVGDKYTMVLSGSLSGSQQFGLWDSNGMQEQGFLEQKNGSIYTLTFNYRVHSSTQDHSFLTLYNYRRESAASNPCDVDWVCLYKGEVTNIPEYFIPAYEDINESLLATGIDIDAKTVTVTASSFRVQDNSGTPIAVFKTDSSGNPVLQAEYIDVEELFANDIVAYGSIRSPFTNAPTGDYIDYSDNVAMISKAGGGWTANYSLPWDAAQSGRKICITNYKWKAQTAQGWAIIEAPSGKYFYENGLQKTTLNMSRECVELLGYGDETTFYGWIVLQRINLMTTYKYGRPLNCLAMGWVSVQNGQVTQARGLAFDGSELTVTRQNTGVYFIPIPFEWFNDLNNAIIHVTGIGKTTGNSPTNANNAIKATLGFIDSDGFYVHTSVDSSAADGSFLFTVYNMGDWFTEVGI